MFLTRKQWVANRHIRDQHSRIQPLKKNRRKLFWQLCVKLRFCLFFNFFFFVFESNKSTSRIIYYLKIIQDVVLGHPPPCTQISLWDLMNELLNVIGCCCPPPPPRHPFLLPSDTRGNACLPPCRDGFSILPRSGDDEIRFPQWRWWNTAPAYYYAIGNLSFLISFLTLSLSHAFSIYISLALSLSLSDTRSHSL